MQRRPRLADARAHSAGGIHRKRVGRAASGVVGPHGDRRRSGFRGKENAAVTRLRSMPSIGPVTALAFVAALDDVTRFQSAHQVQAYLGLVPSEYSSGDRRLRGRITKRGDAWMRWLLVETAWRILRSPNPDLAGLRVWAQQIAERRGKRIATVALARRVASILYAMWRDDADFAAIPVRAVAA